MDIRHSIGRYVRVRQNIYMELSKLIDKLMSGEDKLSLLLLQAKEHAEAFNDSGLIEFITLELDGYSTKEIPQYRILRSEIIGTVKDSYGRVVQQDQPIDFSVLSDHLGFDITNAVIPDGIGFIEDALQNITSAIILRPIHPELVKMLNSVVEHNNPGMKLTSAHHRTGKAALQFILTKVRQDLIIKLQELRSAQVSVKKEHTSNKIKSDSKKVFVTYAWENEEHDDRVISFVEFLRINGYDASMDKKESQEESAINFNKMMVEGIQNSDKVIVVLSPKYKKKADTFEGGVGVEYQLILEEIKSNPNKFIFVSFGTHNREEITPTGIKGRDVIDLKKEQDENEFNNLWAKLQSANVLNFSEVKETPSKPKTKTIKPFKL